MSFFKKSFVCSFKRGRVSKILILSYFASLAIFAQQPLVFIVNYPGSEPYLYIDRDTGLYMGVIPDVLHGIMANHQLNIKFISNSRRRSEEYMYLGKADLMMLSKSWLQYPDKLIATKAIDQHRSYLYQTSEFSKQFSLATVSHKIICTRKGFSYPNLQPYFDSGQLIRMDLSGHRGMLRVLFKKRCDYIIYNEYSAIAIIKEPEFRGKKIYRSPDPISSVPLNIILRPKFFAEKNIIDKQIIQLQQSGELKRIIEKHRKNIADH
ncbi:MAG: transporter substrate-binding domain-containing protein [Alteromonadaceae bacterium]|nr:transporter substrate-binding domain-containing protein [Alteromonadaceae bacterium]